MKEDSNHALTASRVNVRCAACVLKICQPALPRTRLDQSWAFSLGELGLEHPSAGPQIPFYAGLLACSGMSESQWAHSAFHCVGFQACIALTTFDVYVLKPGFVTASQSSSRKDLNAHCSISLAGVSLTSRLLAFSFLSFLLVSSSPFSVTRCVPLFA